KEGGDMRHAIVLTILAALAIPAATARAATKAVVTIDAAPHAIVYGASTGLTGTVSPGKRDIQVSVLSQSCATGALPALAPSQVTDAVSTDASGAWATPDTPATTTAYAARAEGSTSSTIRVAVKPRVMLRRIARHRYSATVLAAQSFAGRKASFQRFRPS